MLVSSRFLLITACVLAIASESQWARAEERDEPAARSLFFEGRELAKKKQFEAACERFERAYALAPGVGILFNWADCLEQLGRTESAWRRFKEVVQLTRAAGQRERAERATSRVENLERRLSRLTLIVTARPGLVIWRDDVLVDETEWGVPIPIDPGMHEVRLQAPGMKPRELAVRIAPGGSETQLALPALEPETPSPADVAPVPVPFPPRPEPLVTSSALNSAAQRASTVAPRYSPRSLSRSVKNHVGASRSLTRTFGFALAGAGAAALATGVTFALITHRKNEQALHLCPSYSAALGYYVCGSREEMARHDALTADADFARRLSTIGFASGAASLAGATLLLWTAYSATSEQRPQLRPVVGPRDVGMSLEGRF